MAKSDPLLLECKCAFPSLLKIVIFSNVIFSPKVELKHFISSFLFVPTFVSFYPPSCFMSLVLSFHPHAISHASLHASVVLLSLSWLKKKIRLLANSAIAMGSPEWDSRVEEKVTQSGSVTIDHGVFLVRTTRGSMPFLDHSPLNPGTTRGWRNRGLSRGPGLSSTQLEHWAGFRYWFSPGRCWPFHFTFWL